MSNKQIASVDTNGEVTTITYEDGTTETRTQPVKADRLEGITVTVRAPKGWGRK